MPKTISSKSSLNGYKMTLLTTPKDLPGVFPDMLFGSDWSTCHLSLGGRASLIELLAENVPDVHGAGAFEKTWGCHRPPCPCQHSAITCVENKDTLALCSEGS